MKAKIKHQLCEVPGCKDKAICGWQPKHRADKKLWICRKHARQSDIDNTFLWKLVGLPKPEKVRRPKAVIKNHKPKREGKPAWQTILDNWFAKGMYPIGNFMNPKRWEYWISIGGDKPNGESRKFKKATKYQFPKGEAPIHPLLIHKMTKHKKLKAKVRRKKDY